MRSMKVRSLAKRSMKMVLGLGVILAGAMTVGCDSPGGGGGGGGGTSCAVNPNQPGCQAADAAVGQDAAVSQDATSGTDTTAGPDGGASVDPTSCRGVMTCVAGCADTACVQVCAGQASEAANQQLAAISNCEDSFGCSDSLCESEHCSAQLAACSFQGTCGPEPGACLSCKQIVSCRKTSCAPDDLVCISACGAKGAADAKEPAMRLLLCLDGACEGDAACEETATDAGELCHDAWLACDG